MRALWTTSLASLAFFASFNAFAQEDVTTSSWEGLWIADGSNFTLNLRQQDNQLHVQAVESLGFVWKNSVGIINGDTATIMVQYQGVTASILVRKDNIGKAIARPVNCRPDYHILCAMVQNQQAVFTKVTQTARRN